jgi:hypothetical protein
LRIDSLILNADFYNSNTNSKLAIAYSLSGFTTDSTDFMAASFTSPITLNKNTSGTVDNYRFALNGATGINVPAGKSISFRFYYALGSSSAGRYGMLNNVIVKGDTNLSVVPLTLLSFTASTLTNAVQLNWSTTNEISSKNFIIERSMDGIHFTAIGTVNANNNINVNNYAFTDANAVQGLAYYRLRIIDLNGNYKLSQVLTIKTASKNTFIVYPNPATDIVGIKYPVLSQSASIKLNSIEGKTLQCITLAQGTSQATINIKSLSKGTYFIIINKGQGAETLRFVKQ